MAVNVNIGVDIGGRNARMCIKGRGLVMDQPSAWALRRSGEALGDEAFALLGREPRGLQVVFPLAGGVIAYEAALAGWLRHLIQRAASVGLAHRPRLLIARPPSMAPTQMKQLVAMALDAGALTCALVRSDMCAALGAGLGIAAPRGNMVIDVGASSVTAALIVLNTVVASDSLPLGMAGVDEAIVRMLSSRYALHVGLRTAEAVKVSLASAARGAELVEQVAGLDGESGFPRTVQVAIADVVQVVEPLLEPIAQMAERMMRLAGHEMMIDLMDGGIALTGGGAQIYGLDRLIAERTGVSCRVADAPALATARGLSIILDNPDEYDRLGEAYQTILEKRLPGARR